MTESSPRSVDTASGTIAYTELGAGPVALFVHGVLPNSHLWRHQIAHLSDIRRCIALDLLAHGGTEIAPDQDVSVTANARMIGEFLDALKIDQVDLVGNDSGGGIAQIFAATNSGRVRSLTLVARDARGDADGQERLPLAAGPGADTIPGTRRRVELQGARIFFPEERWAEFDRELRAHWQA